MRRIDSLKRALTAYEQREVEKNAAKIMSPDPKRPSSFTIGQAKSYLKNLAECYSCGGALLKKGMYNNYPGGIVFITPMDARRYINENLSENTKGYSVFELDADWEHDCYEQTELFDNCYWRYLISDRPIICLVEDA